MDDSLEQPSPMRIIPDVTTGDTTAPLDLPHLMRVCEALQKARLGASTLEFSRANARFELDCNEDTVLSLLHRLMAAEKHEDQLEVCLANILHADARGQGLPFKEAMDKAHELLMYERKAP